MEERTKIQHQTAIDNPLQDSQRFGHNYFVLQTGSSCDTIREIVKYVHKHVPGLKEVDTLEECDVILVVCPIVSRAGTDITAALDKLNTCSESKPAVFMVLHHTYDKEKIVPDSSRFINRSETLTVNLLFNEDDGLLKCNMNHQALIKITEHFNPQWQNIRKNWSSSCEANMLFQAVTRKVQILWQQEKNCLWFIISIVANILFWLFQVIVHRIKIIQKVIGSVIVFPPREAERHNYFILQTGSSCDTVREILRYLQKHVPGLKEVDTLEGCDVILVVCPIVSRAGTDMEAALDQLNKCSESKPAVFMVLHHTYDKEKIVPDSSRFINRSETLTVNFLFNEDDRLLKCNMNHQALIKITEHFNPQNVKNNWFTNCANMLFWFQICLRFIFSCGTNMLFWLQDAITKIQILWQQEKNCLWFIMRIAANILFWLFQVIVHGIKMIQHTGRKRKRDADEETNA